MVCSLLTISATTGEEGFMTPQVRSQLQWFVLGTIVFLFFAGLDYNKLKQWTTAIYFLTILLLIGLFFVDPINNCRRWYKISGIPFAVQPSEAAKLTVVIALSLFIDIKGRSMHLFSSVIQGGLLVLLPFALILKQPDLGSALVLFPISLVMLYFGGASKKVVMALSAVAAAALLFVVMMFLGVISHDDLRPAATKVVKEYQYERLNPDNYHQRAAAISVSLGKITGSGWHKSTFSGRGWLPYAYSDSVFPAFVEEFGLLGALFMLLLFCGLIYFSVQVTAIAKDNYARVLSAGLSTYLAIHVVVNIGMMCGLLPITGVPLILVTSGGSSILTTMAALGIIQSVYARRFMF